MQWKVWWRIMMMNSIYPMFYVSLETHPYSGPLTDFSQASVICYNLFLIMFSYAYSFEFFRRCWWRFKKNLFRLRANMYYKLELLLAFISRQATAKFTCSPVFKDGQETAPYLMYLKCLIFLWHVGNRGDTDLAKPPLIIQPLHLDGNQHLQRVERFDMVTL